MIDYDNWADEYLAQANLVQETIYKYETLLKESGSINRERINNIIFQYKLIKADLLRTAKPLSEKRTKVKN